MMKKEAMKTGVSKARPISVSIQLEPEQYETLSKMVQTLAGEGIETTVTQLLRGMAARGLRDAFKDRRWDEGCLEVWRVK